MKTKLFLVVTVKTIAIYVRHFFMKAVLFLLHVHVNCFDLRFFSPI